MIAYLRATPSAFLVLVLVGGAAHLSDEAIQVRWVTQDEIDELMTPATAARLREALFVADAPSIRGHGGVQLLDL